MNKPLQTDACYIKKSSKRNFFVNNVRANRSNLFISLLSTPLSRQHKVQNRLFHYINSLDGFQSILSTQQLQTEKCRKCFSSQTKLYLILIKLSMKSGCSLRWILICLFSYKIYRGKRSVPSGVLWNLQVNGTQYKKTSECFDQH